MARRQDRKLSLITAMPGNADTPLPERIAGRIAALIVDEAYQPGHKLPNEFILAERLGVGRSTVREAIKLLASRNVLEARHGSGTYVSENTGMIDDPLGFRFFRNKKRLTLDLCEIRLMLEPQLAAAAARNASSRQVDEMQRYCDEVVRLYGEEMDHSDADIGLHAKIAEASGNIVAPRLVEMISTAIPLFVHITERSLREETIDTHQRMVDAIGKRAPRRAASVMEEHIKYNQKNFLTLPDDF